MYRFIRFLNRRFYKWGFLFFYFGWCKNLAWLSSRQDTAPFTFEFGIRDLFPCPICPNEFTFFPSGTSPSIDFTRLCDNIHRLIEYKQVYNI